MDREYREIRKKVLTGTKIAHRKMMKEKKEKNLDIAISVNGKAVIIPARDL